MRGLFLIVLCGLLTGCANDRVGDRLVTWHGSRFEDVTAAWGQPVECSRAGVQRLCKWPIRPTAADASADLAVAVSCTTILAFDEAGMVTGWRWRGDRCRQVARAIVVHGDPGRPDAFRLETEAEPASDLMPLGKPLATP